MTREELQNKLGDAICEYCNKTLSQNITSAQVGFAKVSIARKHKMATQQKITQSWRIDYDTKQTWKDEIRILITDEENLGSVQISIPLYVSDIFGKADALIYALFVDDTHRRCGVAKRLLQLAEQQAKLNGVKIIGLEFNKDESESFVFEWYLNNGYKPFNKESNLLIKKYSISYVMVSSR